MLYYNITLIFIFTIFNTQEPLFKIIGQFSCIFIFQSIYVSLNFKKIFGKIFHILKTRNEKKKGQDPNFDIPSLSLRNL